MRHVLLLAGILAGPLAAQSQIQLGETLELPSFGPGRSDHATLAMNQRGDVFVAWHTLRTDLAEEPFQVEGAFLRYLGGGRWEVPSAGSTHFLLGDPTVLTMGSASFESCPKPDVCAVGMDFVVTWPRTPRGEDRSVLEAVRILTGPFGAPVVDAPAPGTGYVIDGNLSKGVAGVMPDLTSVAGVDQVVEVAYVHADWTAGPLREFDIRYARVDFRSTPPTISGPFVLVEDVPFDDPLANGGPTGGKILPDVVQDDYGHLVLAYEAYRLTGHRGAVQDEGWIAVERFLTQGSAPVPVDGTTLQTRKRRHWQRRPNLATSRLDVRNAVSVAWMESAVSVDADVNTSHYEVTFEGGPTAGNVGKRDLGFPNDPAQDDYHPVALHGRELRLALSAHRRAGSSQILGWIPTHSGVLHEVTPLGADAWRPAADLLEIQQGGNPAGFLVPMCYEAPNPTGDLRIFLVIHRL